MENRLMALDEDPDAALAVITGKHRGNKAWAAVCLADAIRHGDYPGDWRRLTPLPVSSGTGHEAVTAQNGTQKASTADIHVVADEIRSMGGQDLTNPQDVHDAVTGMHELVAAVHENLGRWGGQLESSGMHPAYADAVQAAAVAMAGIADRLQAVTGGGVMHGPGG
jgi:hypothetical protein